MTLRSQTLGLALAAALVMGATWTVEVQAESFHSSAPPTTLSGSQVETNKFHIPGGGIAQCTSANFPGQITSATVSQVRVSPEYAGCSMFGFPSGEIITTGCHYLFTTPASKKATTHIECTGGAKIKLTPTFLGSSICTIEIPSQTVAGSTDFENKESEHHVLLTWTWTAIYHTEGCGVKTAADGEYTGSVTEKGGADSIWVT